MNGVLHTREVMTATEMGRAFTRMAHEMIERNKGADNLLLAGIPTRGVYLADRLAALIGQFEGELPEPFVLDPTRFRDDSSVESRVLRLSGSARAERGAANVDGMRVVVVDDVFNTGRTARAALDALMQFGRPSRVQLAVLVNRGHRELPISPDFVGKHIPTARSERVNVNLIEVDGRDCVALTRPEEGQRS